MKENKMLKVLAVDDDAKTLNLLGIMLKNNGYDYKTVGSSAEALLQLKEFVPDLVVIDEEMPEIDGIEVCKRIKENPITKSTAVILMSSMEDRNSRLIGLSAGADDFLRKPLDDTELMVRTQNVLKLKELTTLASSYSESLENEIEEKTRQLREGHIETILKLTIVSEYNDEQTGAHIVRVGKYSEAIASVLGWSKEDQETIRLAACMHDIGKVGIPIELFLKPRKLSAQEFDLVKTHTTIGANLLRGSSSKYLEMAESIALSHHERFDGTGYPNGLRGDDIPMAARIVSAADQYDALRSKRAFREAMDHAAVANIIIEGDGRTMPEHFDPRVLKAFIGLSAQFDEIFTQNKD